MPKFELLLTGEFSAAHQLRLADGTTEPLHGHNWSVEVCLEGQKLDSIDVLADFTVLQPMLKTITDRLHDTFLNDHSSFANANPSTELVAKLIHDEFAPSIPPNVKITKVRVWETRTCAAAYIP